MTAKLLTFASCRAYSAAKELENSEARGIRTRQPCGFFASGHPSMAGMGSNKIPRNGELARRRASVFNIPAALPVRVKTFQQGLVRLSTERIMTTNTQVVPFVFNSNEVRIVILNGDPWFVCTDVAKTLGYRDAHNAARCLDDDEKGTHNLSTPYDDDKKDVQKVDTLGGDQSLTIISESGLYALVLRSRKPEARKFAKWVTAEVLPAIRKTGRYSVATALPDAHPSINVRELLLTGQCAPSVSLPEELRKAIDQRAFVLAHEAFELCREHLARRVAYTSEIGRPRFIDRDAAIKAIDQGDLGQALAHAYFRKLNALARIAKEAAEDACDFAAKMDAITNNPSDERRAA